MDRVCGIDTALPVTTVSLTGISRCGHQKQQRRELLGQDWHFDPFGAFLVLFGVDKAADIGYTDDTSQGDVA